MRLKSVYISQYKNLINFTLNFDGNSFIDVFVGKNGTGKSNLFEALIEIFRHIYEYNKNKEELAFDYSITFVINGKETKIDYISGELKINGESRTTIRKNLLPDNVLIYYSGHNNTVANLVKKYEDKFRERIKKANFGESRHFIGIGSEYKELLLSVLLIQPQDNKAQQYICKKLTIQQIGLEVKLILKRPAYAEKNSSFDIENNDESDRYWKAEGITKTFLDRLSNCISEVSGNIVRDEGYFPNDDQYILYFDIAQIQQKFSDFSSQDLFREFDNLKTLNMLKEISIPLILEDGEDATISYFSDGQFQSVYIYSIIEIFKDRNCITLLDEPDSFLHPEWQFEFLDQIFEITDKTAQNNHVLMSSHSAATLFPIEEQTITLFKIENSEVQSYKESKKEIIKSLSNSLIQYSEDERKLLIENAIRTSSKPILFVEGPSDVSILNTAFEKIFPNEDMTFLIQDAFDRGFIRTLLSRDDIFRNYPNKPFFALFDFDDAYQDWWQMEGDIIEDDINKGRCKKLDKNNAHIFLLPIPENKLKSQVWSDENKHEKIIKKPHFCIEHIFWEQPQLASYYRTITFKGCERIQFKKKSDKVKFAKEVVPMLDAACFEIFRPMFDFIRSHC
ncbi:AAA family ATPase [Microcoleus sp.]|uniref:AAA family ATPase n=1 Tax=Microcoleus sp. TaxID=44472 RepID=UPI00403E8ED6